MSTNTTCTIYENKKRYNIASFISCTVKPRPEGRGYKEHRR